MYIQLKAFKEEAKEIWRKLYAFICQTWITRRFVTVFLNTSFKMTVPKRPVNPKRWINWSQKSKICKRLVITHSRKRSEIILKVVWILSKIHREVRWECETIDSSEKQQDFVWTNGYQKSKVLSDNRIIIEPTLIFSDF